MTEAGILFKQLSSSSGENTVAEYKTLFKDGGRAHFDITQIDSKKEGEKRRNMLVNMKFKAKSQTNSTFASWTTNLMTRYSEKSIAAGIKKALNLSKSLVLSRCPEDMEFLVSRWSPESHFLLQHGASFGQL